MHSSLIGPLFHQVGISVTVQEVLSGGDKEGLCGLLHVCLQTSRNTQGEDTSLSRTPHYHQLKSTFYSTD